jgi:CubicO group peptidase (beta-lactamase class C family)
MNTSIIRNVVLLSIMAFVVSAVPGQGKGNVGGLSDSSRVQEVVSTLEKTVPDLMNRAGVPGISIGLIEDGKLAWIGSFGVKNTKLPFKVDDRTVFSMGSISKVVFTYGVLKLVEQGKLDLDVPLTKYFPNYVDDDRINLITARTVLTHQTGWPNWRSGSELKFYFNPGERFSYSGEGFAYLQRVVEEITGKTLEEFMQESVLVPLGMSDSSYIWQNAYQTQEAWGHDELGPIERFKPLLYGHPVPPHRGPCTASTLQSTVRDIAKFMIALMDGVGLKKETFQQMLSTQVRVDAGCETCIGKPITHFSEDITWGLGIEIQKTSQGPMFCHGGDNPGFHSFMSGSTTLKRGVVLLSNGDHGPMILGQIADIAMGVHQPDFDYEYGGEGIDSPRMKLDRAILKKGIDEALKDYTAGPALDEDSMNDLGLQLIGQEKFKEAIRILEMNVNAHPTSDAHVHLAKGYLLSGKGLACKNKQKAKDLDPNNGNAFGMDQEVSCFHIPD